MDDRLGRNTHRLLSQREARRASIAGAAAALLGTVVGLLVTWHPVRRPHLAPQPPPVAATASSATPTPTPTNTVTATPAPSVTTTPMPAVPEAPLTAGQQTVRTLLQALRKSPYTSLPKAAPGSEAFERALAQLRARREAIGSGAEAAGDRVVLDTQIAHWERWSRWYAQRQRVLNDRAELARVDLAFAEQVAADFAQLRDSAFPDVFFGEPEPLTELQLAALARLASDWQLAVLEAVLPHLALETSEGQTARKLYTSLATNAWRPVADELPLLAQLYGQPGASAWYDAQAQVADLLGESFRVYVMGMRAPVPIEDRLGHVPADQQDRVAQGVVDDEADDALQAYQALRSVMAGLLLEGRPTESRALYTRRGQLGLPLEAAGELGAAAEQELGAMVPATPRH